MIRLDLLVGILLKLTQAEGFDSKRSEDRETSFYMFKDKSLTIKPFFFGFCS
jgi:hypothetical protein